MFDRYQAAMDGFEGLPEMQEWLAEIKAKADRATLAEMRAPAAPDGYRTKLRTPDDIHARHILENCYIIKGWLDQGADATLFGDWNAGKTFVVLDMAACIALGLPWFGQRVRKSRVLYLGYEGHAGLKRRVKALADKYPGLADAPFAWWPMVEPLTTVEGQNELMRARRDYAERFVHEPEIIIIDTLRKALGGSDSDADRVEALGAYIRGVMAESKCAVLKVHHVGHSNKDRARGDSGIVAGVDSEIIVEAPENGMPGRIGTTKERDAGRGEVFFRLDVVTLGQDEDGDAVTTCVVQPAVRPEPQLLAPAMGVQQRVEANAVSVLRFLARETKAGAEHSRDSLKRSCGRYSMARKDAEDAITWLETRKRIERAPTGRKGGSPYQLTIVGEMPEEGATGFF